MIKSLTDVVLSVTGFQLLLLAVVLVIRFPGNSLRRNFLVAFLLAKVLLILRWSLLHFAILDGGEHATLFLSSCALFFLLAPLLYLHITALCRPSLRPQWTMLLHLGPFVAMTGFGLLGATIDTHGFSTGMDAVDAWIVRHFWHVLWTGNLFQIPLYIGAMFLEVLHYRAKRRDCGLSWLLALLALISIHWLFVATRATLGLLDVEAVAFISLLDLFSITIFLIFTTTLVIRGMTHKAGFLPELKLPRALVSVNRTEDEEIRSKLLAYMKFRKPHLDASLGVDDLAASLKIPGWQLSRILNSVVHQGFFGFVNGFRVQEAKVRLADPDQNWKTMLQILHESGFNSKSTFNEVFKRHTGLTPSEYRKQSQQAPKKPEFPHPKPIAAYMAGPHPGHQ